MSDPTELGDADRMTVDMAERVVDQLRFFLGRGLSYVTDAQNPELAAWQLSFALGTDNCAGTSMTDKAKDLGVTTACLSKGATRVCRILNIPPSSYMLKPEAQQKYRELRQTQETERKGGGR